MKTTSEAEDRKIKYVYKNRLLKLANFLTKLPKNYFDMGIITRSKDFLDYEDRFEKNITNKQILEALKQFKPLTCNTAACAIGWTPKVFPRKLRWNSKLSVALKDNERCVNFKAVEKFFNLSRKESDYLFVGCNYSDGNDVSPKTVAKRIKAFIKNPTDFSNVPGYAYLPENNNRPL